MDDKLKSTLFMARKFAKKAREKAFAPKHNGMEEFEALETDDVDDLDLEVEPQIDDARGKILEATGDDDFELPQGPLPTKGPAERLKFLRSYLTHRTLRGRR